MTVALTMCMKCRVLIATVITLAASYGIITGHQPASQAYAAPATQATMPCRQAPCPIAQPRKPDLPAKTTTTIPAPVISACVPMDRATVNGWRADIGVPALARDSALESASCAWSLHMATTGVFAHGAGGETIVMFPGGTPDQAWPMWKGSPGHYSVLTSTIAHKLGCGAVSITPFGGKIKWYVTCRVTA